MPGLERNFIVMPVFVIYHIPLFATTSMFLSMLFCCLVEFFCFALVWGFFPPKNINAESS